ncbi:TolC family protein [Sulfuricurvum sp.]|uniref:TolC family protein n=3 Tax=Sulfuricurvum sp. TaxID=2025608 RepID=UPI0026198C09|nr:TolC family protein [Sulfuricurvum sp.]MDD3595002.1 TolC family protein [Sulfuricurvum sp.]
MRTDKNEINTQTVKTQLTDVAKMLPKVDYNRSMKIQQPFLIAGIIPLLVLSLQADDLSLLSPEKRSLLYHEQERIDAEHQKLRYNWLSPINLSGSYSRDKSAQENSATSTTESLSASIAQDLFRSGGITYQIAYADTKKQSENDSYNLTVSDLNLQLFTALLSYQKNRYELEQSQKKLDNYDIEIFIKRQLYDAGKADITELNNALMDKSAELKTYASLRYSIAEQRYAIAKLSDIDPDHFSLPTFELIREEDYLKNRLDLRYARSQSDMYDNLYGVTKSGYFPTLTLNASTGYHYYDSQSSLGKYDGYAYSTGLALTLPLTYNASATIQEAKATYLKQVADTADKERDSKASYGQSLALIDSYREYIEITTKNLSLYDELITVTKAGVDTGYKTGYDLLTLQNTKAIEEYTIKINELNIQLELAKLYFAINTAKETL